MGKNNTEFTNAEIECAVEWKKMSETSRKAIRMLCDELKELREENKKLHMLIERQGKEVEMVSYFLIKPKIEQHEICYNAGSKNCKMCEEGECELCGKDFEKIKEEN